MIIGLSTRGLFSYPDLVGRQLLDTVKWLLLTGFVFLIPWLEYNIERCKNMLGMVLAGLILGEVTHSPPLNILTFDIGSDPSSWQPHFQFEPSGITGVVACIALLGLSSFRSAFLAKHEKWGLTLTVVWLLCTYLLGYMLIASQSRISWLAIILVMPLSWMTAKDSRTNPDRKVTHRIPKILIVPLLAVIALGVAKNSSVFTERMSRDLTILSAHSSSAIDENSSFGLRMKMAEFGAKAFLREPLMGWGNRGTPSIAKEFNDLRYRSPLPDGELIWFPHLHNTYLETALRFGAIGIAFFVACFALYTIYMYRAIRSAKAENTEASRILGFAASCMLTLVICAVAGFQILQESWRAAFWISMALSFSFPFNSSSTGRFYRRSNPESFCRDDSTTLQHFN
jgi:O-antigen ligase